MVSAVLGYSIAGKNKTPLGYSDILNNEGSNSLGGELSMDKIKQSSLNEVIGSRGIIKDPTDLTPVPILAAGPPSAHCHCYSMLTFTDR